MGISAYHLFHVLPNFVEFEREARENGAVRVRCRKGNSWLVFRLFTYLFLFIYYNLMARMEMKNNIQNKKAIRYFYTGNDQ